MREASVNKRPSSCYRLDGLGESLLGNRLTVDPRTLTPLVLVRIQVPQPFKYQAIDFSVEFGLCES